MAASSDTASLRVVHGRWAAYEWKYAAFSSSAASAPGPTSTARPAARSCSSPPAASGFGSWVATTTRRIPAATMAGTQGGVFPWWTQGSRVTYSVAPRALLPAALSASISAWGPPNCRWAPSPTMASERTTTAPTIGLGDVCPQPARASSSARPMNAASVSARGWSGARASTNAPVLRERRTPRGRRRRRCNAHRSRRSARQPRPR